MNFDASQPVSQPKAHTNGHATATKIPPQVQLVTSRDLLEAHGNSQQNGKAQVLAAPATTTQNGHVTAQDRAESEPYFNADAMRTGTLKPDHREKLKAESGLSDEAINARGYWTCEEGGKATLKYLGLSADLGRCLIIPLWNHRGERAGHIARLDNPIKGKPKYRFPKGATNVLDVNPLVRGLLDDPNVPLLVTEGAKTADSANSRGLCCINLNGVYGFRGTNDKGGIATLAALNEIVFTGKKPSGEKFGRVVYVTFDSDVTVNPKVEKALRNFSAVSASRGAIVKIVTFEAAANGDKTGMDEFFARDGGTVEKLFSMARDLESESERKRRQASDKDKNPYTIEGGCIVMQTERAFGAGTVIVADFAAHITEEIISENGERMYCIEGKTRYGDAIKVDIEAKTFDDDYTLKRQMGAAAGARAAIRAGAAKHIGPAIKLLSTSERRITKRFDRTGWHDEKFLIPGRIRDGQQIVLPDDLPYFIDPAAQLGLGLEALEALIEAQEIQATAPLLAAYLQAPFAPRAAFKKRYAVAAIGRTGTFKTTVNQLLMSIYGPKFADDEYLTRWGEGATRNAILKQGTYCHDMPSITDNFKPNIGRAGDFAALVNSIVEGGEKKRLDSNSDLKASKSIRTVPIFTGEDIPDDDPATLARVLIIPFPVFGQRMNRNLSKAQVSAHHLCAVGGAWLDWLESDEGAIIANRAGQMFGDRRDAWAQVLYNHNNDTQNAFRIASNLATNELTWWAMRHCPVLAQIAEKFSDAHAKGLLEISKAMAANTAESLEASRYLSAIRELLASGKCILLNRHASISDSGKNGSVIGYEDDNGAYILPGVARAEIEKNLGKDRLGGVTDRTIYDQLKQLDAIQSSEEGRKTQKIRIPCGRTQRVLHLKELALNENKLHGDNDE